MSEGSTSFLPLPSASDLRQAIDVYLDRTYGGAAPPSAERFRPPGDFEPAEWLMGDAIEREPPDAAIDQVRWFALRIGNAQYPHMKLRLTRVPTDGVFVLNVDSHDAFLSAPPGSPDSAALEELKRHNATLAAAVISAWDAAGLLTERDFLRQKIRQARDAKVGSQPADPEDAAD